MKKMSVNVWKNCWVEKIKDNEKEIDEKKFEKNLRETSVCDKRNICETMEKNVENEKMSLYK